MVNNIFSQADLASIRNAVQAAERRTRGEIVPIVVPASARYREAAHVAGLIVALVTLAAMLSFDYGWGAWSGGALSHGWIVVGVVAAYLIGHVLGTQPWCVRLLTPDRRMAMKVRLRAESAFYKHGLHRTREATGVLVLLSLLERRVQILADQAINERVPPGTWDEMVTDLVEGIRGGRPADALCRAIRRCGDLLAVHFPAREGDNPNELTDDLIREQ